MYVSGGLFFVTSRILIVDMLKKIIPTELISGVVILKAEKIAQTSAESFILSEFARQNKKGFIKAFCQHPNILSLPGMQIEKIVKSLRLRKVALYPRYQKSIIEGYKASSQKIEYYELDVEIDSLQKKCHGLLIDLISACVSEIHRLMKSQGILST